MSIADWFNRNTISDADVRAEVWRLGARHRGYPLEGAIEELKAPGLAQRETALLQACIRDLKRR